MVEDADWVEEETDDEREVTETELVVDILDDEMTCAEEGCVLEDEVRVTVVSVEGLPVVVVRPELELVVCGCWTV